MPHTSASSPAPVFLICSERSGSNLISTMMGAHSNIYAHLPYHFGSILLRNLHETLPGDVQSEAWKQLRRRTWKRVQTLGPQDQVAGIRKWLDRQTQINPIAIARYLYQDAIPEAQGKLVFIKENNLHHLMFFLLHCFRDAKFVFQVRDPRDYLLSAKALRAKADRNKFGTTEQALKVWKEDKKGGLQALALLGPERVFLHRYEDLLIDPETLLKRLTTFLGLAFEPAMLDFNTTEKAIQLAQSTVARQNISQPLLQSNFAKYRTGLTTEEITLVENACRA